MNSFCLAFIISFLALAQSGLNAQASPDSKQSELETSAHVFFMEGPELEKLISDAQAGNAEAQYWLGIKCREDEIETMKAEEAERWFLKSAEQGFVLAEREYGRMKAPGDPVVGERWLLRAADQGDADAEMTLGFAFEQNWFGATDLQESIRWYRKAADAGQVDAQMLLGNRYEMGHGVEQNYVLAAQWYRKAAEQVLPLSPAVGEARYHLGLLYMAGHGVPQDYIQAYFWLRLERPEGEELDKAKAHLNAAQVDATEQLVKDWREHHRLKPEIARAYDIREEP